MRRPTRARTTPAALALILALVSVAVGCGTYDAGRLYARGTRALDLRDPEAAIRDLERAAALVPHASEIHNHLGLAYAAAGRDLDALRSFEHALALDCDTGAARYNLVQTEARLAARDLARGTP